MYDIKICEIRANQRFETFVNILIYKAQSQSNKSNSLEYKDQLNKYNYVALKYQVKTDTQNRFKI